MTIGREHSDNRYLRVNLKLSYNQPMACPGVDNPLEVDSDDNPLEEAIRNLYPLFGHEKCKGYLSSALSGVSKGYLYDSL